MVGGMVRHSANFTWDGIDIHPYKEDGTHFKSIHRQTIFRGAADLGVELRYFEVGAGGHSTLERHDHIHSVMVIRGRGQCLVGDAIYDIAGNDLVYVPTMTWHQFRANQGEPLGFLCLVNVERDRPQRPNEKQTAELKALPKVGEFIVL